MLHRLELFVHHVLLSIAYCKSVAFHIFRARFLSVDLNEHIVFGVHKTDAAAVHCFVHHGAKVDEQPKLVICVKPCVVHSVCNVFELENRMIFHHIDAINLSALSNDLGKGLKKICKKNPAFLLPGLIGSIVSFNSQRCRTRQGISFQAEHTWLLILAVVFFLMERFFKR